MENKKIIITGITAMIIGLALGYFIFGNKHKKGAHLPMNNDLHDTAIPEAGEWICAMHPQIRQSEPGLCPICEMDLTLASENNSNDPLVLEMTEAAVKLSNIQTTIIGQKNTGQKNIQLNGKIKTDERRTSNQVAHVPGRIEKLFVTFTGESVRKGQKLATIYSPELITAQRELLEAVKIRALNADLINAAKNKLRYWKISDKTIEEIINSETIKETFTLFAETSGVVTRRRIAVGDYVKQGQVLFDLTDLNRVWVLFDAYEEDLSNIRLGNGIEFTTPAVPGKKFSTTINFIDPVIDSKTRTAAIRGEVSNTAGKLKPEMFVRGTIGAPTTDSERPSVPKSAVMWTGKRSVVYVKLPSREIPSFQFRVIEIGESVGQEYVVESGLEVGEEVVTYGSFVIDAAAQLNNQMSMMNLEVKLKKESMGVPDFRAVTPGEFKKQLKVLTDNYLKLKNSLINTDPTAAAKAANEFLQELEKMDMSWLKEEAQLYWVSQLPALQQHGEKLANLTDVEEQRGQFQFLSDAIINCVKAFGTTSEKLYVQYCPMAIDNEGADWLASEEEIRNPYFGDKMMKCGSVKADLSADTSE